MDFFSAWYYKFWRFSIKVRELCDVTTCEKHNLGIFFIHISYSVLCLSALNFFHVGLIFLGNPIWPRIWLSGERKQGSAVPRILLATSAPTASSVAKRGNLVTSELSSFRTYKFFQYIPTEHKYPNKQCTQTETICYMITSLPSGCPEEPLHYSNGGV